MRRKRQKDIFICGECGTECVVEGEFGDWCCYCDVCGCEAIGFDPGYYDTEKHSEMIDGMYDYLYELKREFNS